MRRMAKFIPILIQNSCGMKNNAPSLCDTVEQTIYPCNQCSEMACACGCLPPLPNVSPCASSSLKRCSHFLCPSSTHTIVATAHCVFFSCRFYMQFLLHNLGFPSIHTNTRVHTRQLWLANDLSLTNGSCNVNGTMASMQMYAKQIRYGRKQTSIFFSASQPHPCRELTWCSWRTPSAIDARTLVLEPG